MNHATNTTDYPERRFVRWLMWYTAMRARALTPAGRYERRVLSRPDVQEGLRRAVRDLEEWKATLP